MPKGVAPSVFALTLVTGFILGQLFTVAAGRPFDTGSKQATSSAQESPVRESTAMLETLPAEISTSVLTLPSSISPRTPRLERLSLPRFASYTPPPHGGMFISVESGSVQVHVRDRRGGEDNLDESRTEHDAPFAGASTWTVSDGTPREIRPAFDVQIANRELTTSVVMLLTVPAFDQHAELGYEPTSPTYSSNAAIEFLMHGLPLAAGDLQYSATFQQVMVNGGGEFARSGEPSAALMLFVARGTVELTQTQLTDVNRDQTLIVESSETQHLTAGEGMTAVEPGEIVLRNAATSDAIVWLLVVSPLNGCDPPLA